MCLYVFDVQSPFGFQEVLENDPEPYTSYPSEYELMSSHMDPFQIQFHISQMCVGQDF